MNTIKLEQRYKKLYPTSVGVSEENIQKIEQYLNIKLPKEFREIITWYSGGIIGSYSIFNINSDLEDRYGILFNTMFFRDEVNLPNSLLILYYEYGAIFLCLDNVYFPSGSVFHIDDVTLGLFEKGNTSIIPLKLWDNFYDFFKDQF